MKNPAAKEWVDMCEDSKIYDAKKYACKLIREAPKKAERTVESFVRQINGDKKLK